LTKPITLYIDADARPVKNEVYRVIERHASIRYVMAGLVPAIYVFAPPEDVDARHKTGHDECD
jgi:uncharacterized protein YaiI (UPF0178 family)